MGTFRRLAGLATLACAMAFLIYPATSTASSGQMTVTRVETMANPCNGDTVVVTEVMHMVYLTNDNKVEIQTNWQDTSGVALDGTLYQANDADHFYILPASETIDLRDSYELVSQDGTSNFLVHELMEISLATGEVTMKGDEECSGPTPP